MSEDKTDTFSTKSTKSTRGKSTKTKSTKSKSKTKSTKTKSISDDAVKHGKMLKLAKIMDQATFDKLLAKCCDLYYNTSLSSVLSSSYDSESKNELKKTSGTLVPDVKEGMGTLVPTP